MFLGSNRTFRARRKPASREARPRGKETAASTAPSSEVLNEFVRSVVRRTRRRDENFLFALAASIAPAEPAERLLRSWIEGRIPSPFV
jgi:hypothetical protein